MGRGAEHRHFRRYREHRTKQQSRLPTEGQHRVRQFRLHPEGWQAVPGRLTEPARAGGFDEPRNTLHESGDELVVTLTDTAHGLKITVRDLTTHESGFMVASAKNGFASVRWDPNGTNCAFATHNIPHDFHPTYATSSERT